MARRKRFDIGLVLLLLIILLVAGVGAFLYTQVRADRITQQVEQGAEIRFVLVLAEDDAPVLTELVLFNPTTRRGALFDIPENTGGLLETLNRVDRMSALYRESGVDAYREGIARLVDLEVPYHLTMDLRDFAGVVDLIGGLEVFIADSVERIGEEELILLPGGNVVLDGEKAVDFLRLTYAEEADIDRIGRHHTLVESLLAELGNHSERLTGRRSFEYLSSRIRTNLEPRALSALVRSLRGLDVETLVNQRVIGNLRSVETGAGQVELLFPYFEGEWLRETVQQVSESIARETATDGDLRIINVEILNGTTINGLASRTRQLYEATGVFEVVEIGNASRNDVENTVVIDRRGDLRMARRAADIIRADEIISEPGGDNDLAVDVTIILGRDFDGRNVQQ